MTRDELIAHVNKLVHERDAAQERALAYQNRIDELGKSLEDCHKNTLPRVASDVILWIPPCRHSPESVYCLTEESATPLPISVEHPKGAYLVPAQRQQEEKVVVPADQFVTVAKLIMERNWLIESVKELTIGMDVTIKERDNALAIASKLDGEKNAINTRVCMERDTVRDTLARRDSELHCAMEVRTRLRTECDAARKELDACTATLATIREEQAKSREMITEAEKIINRDMADMLATIGTMNGKITYRDDCIKNLAKDNNALREANAKMQGLLAGNTVRHAKPSGIFNNQTCKAKTVAGPLPK